MAKQSTTTAAPAAPAPAEAVGLESPMAELLKGELAKGGVKKVEAPVVSAVEQLIKMLTEGSVTVSDDVIRTINDAKAHLDKKLSEQLNEIMHHEDFLKMEGTWRGLHTLVMKSEL